VEGPALRCPSSEGTQGPKARLIREGKNLESKSKCKCIGGSRKAMAGWWSCPTIENAGTSLTSLLVKS